MITAPFPGTRRFHGHKGPVYALCALPDAGSFLSTGSDGTVARWHVDTPEQGLVVARVERAVFAMHLAGPQRLYLGDVDGGLHVVDLGLRHEVQLERAHTMGLYALQELPDGRLVAAGGDGRITVWEPATGNGRALRLQRRIPLSDAKLRGLTLSPDGQLLGVACGDGPVHLLDAASLNERFTLKGHDIGANCMAWHPGKPVLVTGGKDGHVRLWHAADSFRELQAFPAHKETIYHIAFSPDGRFCATASRDKTAKIWDAATFSPLRRLDRAHGGHGYSVNDLLWQGSTLLTASDDKSIVAWAV